MDESKSQHIHFIEIAKDIYAAVTPADPLDITDAGMMDNFSNSAYINRGEGLVSDTFYDLVHAGELRSFCIKKSGHAPGYVFNTHGHWDHYWGNQVFSNADIIGQNDILKDSAGDKKKLPLFHLMNRSTFVKSILNGVMTKMLKDFLPKNQKVKCVVQITDHDFDLKKVTPTPPKTFFDKSMTLDLGGTEVQLLHLGAVHSSSDSVVWIPSEKILFAGDIFADCSLPASVEGCRRWIETMDYILDELKPEKIVPGHGVVYDRERAINQRDYFKSLLEQFETHYTDSISVKELCDKIDVEQFIDHRPRLGWVMAVNMMVSAKRKK